MSIFIAWRSKMAVSFDPRASSTPRAGVQPNDIVRPAPIGLANAPSVLEMSPSAASNSVGCCGWIAAFFEWIRSFFSSGPSFEQRLQKGYEMIDIAYSTPFECNPERTMMVCEFRYNNELEVVFGKKSIVGAQFKDMCRARLANLMVKNEHFANGKLSIMSYYCEKLPDLPHRTQHKTAELRQIVNFAQMQHPLGGWSFDNVDQASVMGVIRRIYRPNVRTMDVLPIDSAFADALPLVAVFHSL